MTTLPHDAPAPLRFDWSAWLGRLGSVIGLAFVFVLFTALVEVVPDARPFATISNLELMLRQTAVVGVAALGMTLVIISGGIDLSVGSVMALSGVVIAQLLLRFHSATLAAAGGLAAGVACGLLTGLLITQLKLSPFIVTLGLWGAVRGAAKGFAGNTSVYPPAPPQHAWDWRDTWLFGLLGGVPEDRRWMLLPAGVWLMVILGVLVALMLRYTRLGRHVFAIGSSEQTARLCGVPVTRTKLAVYLLGSAFAGLAGLLEFSYIRAGDPTTRVGAELDVIAAVVIGGASLAGGQGSVFGSLVGALLMTMVANGCTKLGLPNWVQEIATGGIIIFAAALDRLRRRRAT